MVKLRLKEEEEEVEREAEAERRGRREGKREKAVGHTDHSSRWRTTGEDLDSPALRTTKQSSVDSLDQARPLYQ